MTASTAPEGTHETPLDLVPPAELLARNAPMLPSERVDTCPVCSGSSHRPFAVGFDYELLTCRNSWRFVRCDACGHVWLNPRPAIETLPIIYPQSYYAYNYEKAINPIAVRGKEMLDALKVNGVLRKMGAPPRRYLDIGCGSGRFLKALEKKGLARENLYGLELDPTVAGSLAAQGYQVSAKRVEEWDGVPPGHLDLVTMFHVIEHLDDPGRVVERVAEWLAPGGVFAIETPNRDSFDARAFEGGLWGGYHIPRHWHIFTPESLARLFERAGLDVISVQYQTGHSFWLYSFHHRLRYGDPPSPRLAQWFDPFKGFLPLLVLFTCYDKARALLGFRTSSMLMIGRKRSAAGAG